MSAPSDFNSTGTQTVGILTGEVLLEDLDVLTRIGLGIFFHIVFVPPLLGLFFVGRYGSMLPVRLDPVG